MENLESLEYISVKEQNVSELSSPEILNTEETSTNDAEGIAVVQNECQETNFDTAESLQELSKLNGEGLEIVSDFETTESIAEYLSNVEGLQYEEWCKLSVEERTQLMNEIEENIAAIEHRPPVKVGVEEMEGNTFGYQCSSENRIALNVKYVSDDSRESYTKMIETIVHEGRHAYQHYNVDVQCVHESGSVVETWRENFYDEQYGYYSYEGQLVPIFTSEGLSDAGFRLYYYQPVEIDARNFASEVMSKLEAKGMINVADANALKT